MGGRRRIRTFHEWHEYIHACEHIDATELHAMRCTCYAEIEELRRRPLLVYASALHTNQTAVPNFIDVSDIDGISDFIHSVGDSPSIDVLLHSPGGRPDATERIVEILRSTFDEVHFLIPHSAYSAATMLALSGDTITLHPHATLGPIDPQIDGVPARLIKKGFEKVRDLLASQGPEMLPAYIPLIEKYSLDLLEVCEDSEKLSRDLVSDWLFRYMLKGKERFPHQISQAVDFFSNYDQHLLHSRPLMFDRLSTFNLNISIAEASLSSLLWESYVHLSGLFSVTELVKLFENNRGISWGRRVDNGQETTRIHPTAAGRQVATALTLPAFPVGRR